ncbi:MAG: hypothetical protein KDA60_10745 [Planctomycetales bacterium]|nr:hypothetical protein [Planctomycetales bacterium]
MNKIYSLLAILVLALCVVPSVSNAQCHDLGWGSGQWPYYSPAFQTTPYTLGQVPVPPYFALHPPVYYSAPVARPYGYSPFAYPGNTPTPEIVEEEPVIIENPHVSPSALEATPTLEENNSLDLDHHSASVQPQMITNPFVGVSVANK